MPGNCALRRIAIQRRIRIDENKECVRAPVLVCTCVLWRLTGDMEVFVHVFSDLHPLKTSTCISDS
jgi:hypothetical protein